LPYDAAASFSEQVRQSFASSLDHLGVDYLDSYLLHGPSRRSGLTAADWEVWQELERLTDSGRTRAIGISNVSLEQLRELHARARVKPAFVQNRCYAELGWDREVRAFCAAHEIVYQGFSLLTANRAVLERSAVSRIAQRLGRTLPEVVFRFASDVGMQPLTGTSSLEHMRLDLACNEFELSRAELSAIEQLAD
jgi:diketogulonate reductase-like aldo/keto reductase